MRRISVCLVLLTSLLGIGWLTATGARASCVAPHDMRVTPSSVRAGDAVTIDGTALFECHDTVVVGTPTPSPSPTFRPPTHLNVSISSQREHGRDLVVIGRVPVTAKGHFHGTVTVPGGTTPGKYFIAAEGGGIGRVTVLPAVAPAPKTLPFTGVGRLATLGLVGALMVSVGVVLLAAARARS
jgi:hypothetical protein